MNKTDTIGFIVFGTLAISFFGMVIYEFYGFRNFIERLFLWGLKLISFNEHWGDTRFQRSIDVKETRSGKFKVVSDSKALFRYNQALFSFRVNTLMPFKGVIELKNGTAFVSGRTPLAPSIFIFIWILGWTVGGLSILIFAKENKMKGLALIFLGYVFLGAILGTSYYIEKKRFLAVFSEIKESLGLSANIQSNKNGISHI